MSVGATVEAVVWEGSGLAYPGVPWAVPLEAQLSLLGWRVTVVPWGDPGYAHRGRPGVLHVFSGGMEPISSGSAETTDRLGAVEAALHTAADDACSVVGVCLGAQMIAAVSAGLLPRPVAGGGEAGLTRVAGFGVPDLVVATAHVAEVPDQFLAMPGVRRLWSNDVTTVQGFAVGDRAVGVQFHPELTGPEARWASRAFRQELGAPFSWADPDAVDPAHALGLVLAAAGTDRLLAGADGAAPVSDLHPAEVDDAAACEPVALEAV